MSSKFERALDALLDKYLDAKLQEKLEAKLTERLEAILGPSEEPREPPDEAPRPKRRGYQIHALQKHENPSKGERFGQLTATGRTKRARKGAARKPERMAEVTCSCGTTFWTYLRTLRTGISTRCKGCSIKARTKRKAKEPDPSPGKANVPDDHYCCAYHRSGGRLAMPCDESYAGQNGRVPLVN